MQRLRKFNKNENVRKVIVLGLLCLIVATISACFTFAVYQTETEVQFINAKVGPFIQKDIDLAIKLNGEEVEVPPSKGDYDVTVECDNATGEWDTDKWGALVTNITASRVKCEVNFTTPPPTLSEITAESDRTSIVLSYTASGINVSTTCKWGLEEVSEDEEYPNEVDEVTNSNCTITDLEMDTTYYYQVCAISGGGEICNGGSIKTKPETPPLAEQVELGDYISMTPTSTSYTIPKYLTGYTSDQTINPSELNLWRVIKINEDGTVEVVSEYISSINIYFTGKKGYMNSVGVLNSIASQYDNSKYVIKTRHVGYINETLYCTTLSVSKCSGVDEENPDITLIHNVLGRERADFPGYKTQFGENYWVASREAYKSVDNDVTYSLRNTGGAAIPLYRTYPVGSGYEDDPDIYTSGSSVRPILTFKSDIQIISGDGKSAETAYELG